MGYRVAIVHDYLTQRGGAERVVLAMLRSFPDAVVHTVFYEPSTTFSEFARYAIRPSALNRFGVLRRDPRRALPFLPRAIALIDVADADVVLTSTSGWAHGIRAEVPVVAYCHSPARWLYEPADYFAGLPAVLERAFRLVTPYYRRWDTLAASRVQSYLANSSVVARRIERAYGLSPRIVFPPSTLLDEEPTSPVEGIDPGFFLVVGRRRGYKNIDRVCAAVRDHTDERLVVVGDLPDDVEPSDRIRAVGPVDDRQLRWLYRSCRALVAVSFEDFGLTPVEAFTFGRPVVALAAGGYLDTCVEGLTGVFVPDVEPVAIADGLRRVSETSWDEEAIRTHAKSFHLERFAEEIEQAVHDAAVSTLPASRSAA